MAESKIDSLGNALPRPPYHPQVAALIDAIKPNNNLKLSDIPSLRAQTSPTAESVIGSRPILHHEQEVSSSGSSSILVSTFRRRSSIGEERKRPCIFHIHGGGLIAGNRFLAVGSILDWVIDLNLVCVSVEYRLAPEHPFPAALDDCTAALDWANKNADQLSIDSEKTCIIAGSGGAAIAAGLALRLRDEGQSMGKVAGMLLYSPSLDHRLQTTSSYQFVDGGVADRKSSESFWAWYLGGETGSYDPDDISIYASPASATMLGGLPPVYMDIGACDVHRDQAVGFASKIWRDGGECELHVWPGGCHVFETLVPDLEISKECVGRRKMWIQRTLC